MQSAASGFVKLVVESTVAFAISIPLLVVALFLLPADGFVAASLVVPFVAVVLVRYRDQRRRPDGSANH